MESARRHTGRSYANRRSRHSWVLLTHLLGDSHADRPIADHGHSTLPELSVLVDKTRGVRIGDTVNLVLDTSKSQFFDPETEQSLLWR